MTKSPSLQELTRVAAGVRLAGELLEAHGARALAASATWGNGPRSPILDPTARGNAPDPDDGIAPDKDRYTHAKFVELVLRLERDSQALRGILHIVAGSALQSPEPDTPAQISAAGWCVSCWRHTRPDGSHWCEPVAMQPDGSRRFRDLCLWCGRFQAERSELEGKIIPKLIDALPSNKAKKEAKRRYAQAEKKYPPLELVLVRHAHNDRVTQAMITAALAKLIERAEPVKKAA